MDSTGIQKGQIDYGLQGIFYNVWNWVNIFSGLKSS